MTATLVHISEDTTTHNSVADKCICHDEYVVCAWYTPDYEKWAERLGGDASRLDLPFHSIEVKPEGSEWENITRMKPTIAKRFMRENPGKTIIMVDADARLRGTAEDIRALAGIDTDIAMRFSGKISRSRGTTKMHPWSGTMVLRPTDRTLDLLDRWEEAGVDAPRYATDEATLGRALCEVPGLTITMLDNRSCAGAGEQNPIISHPHRTGKRSRFIRLRHLFEKIFG